MSKQFVSLSMIFIKESLRNKVDFMFTLVLPLFTALLFKYALQGNLKELFGVMVAMSIMSNVAVSMTWDLGRYKRSKMLKKLSVSPISPLELIAAIFIGKLIVSGTSIVLLSAFIASFVEASLSINYLLLIFVFICGSISMMGIAQFIMLAFRTPQSSINGSTIIVGALLVLSGSWTGSLLGGFQWVSSLLPGKYIVSGLNYASSAYSGPLGSIVAGCIYILILGVFITLLLAPLNLKSEAT